MAKTIQIRNVPDDVHRLLRSQAAAAGVSLSAFLLAEIEQVAGQSTNAQILRRAAERGGGIPPGAAAEAVRLGRDS